MESEPFSMDVQDVFFIPGRGAVAYGQVTSGAVKCDDQVEVVGEGQRTRATVIGLEAQHKRLTTAKAGDVVGVLLRGLEREQLNVGMKLVSPGSGLAFEAEGQPGYEAEQAKAWLEAAGATAEV